MHPVDIIKQVVKDPGYDGYGLRVTETPLVVGSSPEPSEIYQDGEPTGKYLPGTSAVHIENGNVERALKNAGIGGPGPNGYYFGKHVSLLGGEVHEHGEDIGEIILRNPKVLHTFEKIDNGPSNFKVAETTKEFIRRRNREAPRSRISR